MIHPEKWRDTINPMELKFRNFEILNIVGYPHAGNDVFQVDGNFKGEKCRAFIKIERQKGADIKNEVEIINKLNYHLAPCIVAYSFDEPAYIITKEAVGERLSTILNENASLKSIEFLEHYGEVLANIHSQEIVCDTVKERRFFEMAAESYYHQHNLIYIKEFLEDNKPEQHNKCFLHGDFHYANILWHNKEISCVLDYELSGIGIREFDIAWAVFLRPSQKFLKTFDEVKLFLIGYKKVHEFSYKDFIYYYILVAGHFYGLGDEEYQEWVRVLIKEAMTEY